MPRRRSGLQGALANVQGRLRRTHQGPANAALTIMAESSRVAEWLAATRIGHHARTMPASAHASAATST